MTTPINNRPRPTPTRTNSAPVNTTQAKPELKRADSAPAKLQNEAKPQPKPTKDSMESAKPSSTSSASAGQAASKAGFFGKLKDAAKNWHKGAQETATQNAHANGSALGILKSAGGVASGINSTIQGGKQLVQGIKNGDANQIAGGALAAGKGALNTVKSGLGTAAAIESKLKLGKLESAAAGAMKGLEGTKAGKAISSAAAEAAHLGKDLTKVDVLGAAAKSTGLAGKIGTTLKQGAAGLLNKVGAGGLAGKLEGSVLKAGEKALGGAKGVETAVKAGETALKGAKGVETAVKTGAELAGTAGKLAGRFAPGLNVGIAAMDVGIAAKTIADPKASIADKVTSGITALGSVAAATNIPIVSQVGAAVSTVSSLVGTAIDHAGDIKKVAEKAGSAIKEGAEKVGNAVKNFFHGW